MLRYGQAPPRASGRAGRLATYQEVAEFLARVERRAYKQAVFAVRDDHLALDIVQDAMLKLTEKYSARPADQLPLLFQRILQNTIRDFHRRQRVRSTWTPTFSSLWETDDADPLETLEAADDSKDRKSTRLNSSHSQQSRMPSSA